MYDELITALRTCVDKDKGCSECPYCKRCMNNTSGKHSAMVDAADAIEELSKLNKKWEGLVLTTLDFIPCWVSVEKRLPDKTGNYLTAFGDGMAMAVNEFMHPRDWLTEEGRKAHPNGKWYWGDVTHWMPLPEPPKEEE